MEKDSKRGAASAYFFEIRKQAQNLVQPHLVPIYEENDGKIEQIGTGFLVQHRDRAVLVTAKHTLYGHGGNENPGDKAIFAAGSLTKIGHLKSHEIVSAMQCDIAALFVDEFEQANCLPSSCLDLDGASSRVTIQGFLARDFRCDAATGTLRPAPRTYTNSGHEFGQGYVGIRYPKSRNRSTDTGMKVMVPRPSGLSGGPMLDSDRLADGQVSVIGVFTEYHQERGAARGEAAAKVLQLLQDM